MPQPVAVSIGNFDGVHLGHQALLRASRDEVGPGGRVIVIAFDPHPQAVLAEQAVPERLTTFDDRARVLHSAGVNEVRKLEPDTRLLALSPQAFAEQVLDEFAPSVIVEGEGFRFGRDRAGDLDLLAEVAGARGCRVRAVAPVEVDLVDQTIVGVSSTRVRWLLGHGRVVDAARLLGRPYSLAGPVVRCDRRGRTIGFPTANIETSTMLPGNGVYAARATLPDGTTCPAAVNVGTRPTVDGTRRCVEAHVLEAVDKGGWKPPPLGDEMKWKTLPGLPEYGWHLKIDLLDWVRDEIRFGSVEALVEQMHRDCARVRDMVRMAEKTIMSGGSHIRGGGIQSPEQTGALPKCNQ